MFRGDPADLERVLEERARRNALLITPHRSQQALVGAGTRHVLRARRWMLTAVADMTRCCRVSTAGNDPPETVFQISDRGVDQVACRWRRLSAVCLLKKTRATPRDRVDQRARPAAHPTLIDISRKGSARWQARRSIKDRNGRPPPEAGRDDGDGGR
jgi:hypothetical protein